MMRFANDCLALPKTNILVSENSWLEDEMSFSNGPFSGDIR